ncbi:MbtH family protein [Embleya sp. NBC_00896]|uniref:MbtH family protein n=1 Tax=Embleya sp. NBC_00896 TaxID=2975961 RepID=UPI002F908004
MSNPFEDDSAEYKVLINDEGQHSLWPAFAGIPDGWTVALDDSSRQDCLGYIEEHWTDLRPLSLIAASS